MSKPFDITKPFRCREKHWTASAIKGPDGRFYGWACRHLDDPEEASWDHFGRWNERTGENARDLVNIPEKHVRWVNVFGVAGTLGLSDPFRSKEEADGSVRHMPISAANRTACIRIEFEEGEGL